MQGFGAVGNRTYRVCGKSRKFENHTVYALTV